MKSDPEAGKKKVIQYYDETAAEYAEQYEIMLKIHINSRGDICMCGQDWDAHE